MEGSRFESLDQWALGVWGQSSQLPEAMEVWRGSPQPLKKTCNFEVKI